MDADKKTLYSALAQLNGVRVEGPTCGECDDGTWYQVAEIDRVDSISTPSSPKQVEKQIEAYMVDITMACCGCGEHVDLEWVLTKEEVDDKHG